MSVSACQREALVPTKVPDLGCREFWASDGLPDDKRPAKTRAANYARSQRYCRMAFPHRQFSIMKNGVEAHGPPHWVLC